MSSPIYSHIYTHTDKINTHTHPHTHTHTQTHTPSHTHTHTNTRTLTHTCAQIHQNRQSLILIPLHSLKCLLSQLHSHFFHLYTLIHIIMHKSTCTQKYIVIHTYTHTLRLKTTFNLLYHTHTLTKSHTNNLIHNTSADYNLISPFDDIYKKNPLQ